MERLFLDYVAIFSSDLSQSLLYPSWGLSVIVDRLVSVCFSTPVCMFLDYSCPCCSLHVYVFLPFSPFLSFRFSKWTKFNVFSFFFILFFANPFAHPAVFIKHLLCTIPHEHCKCLLRTVACPQRFWEWWVLKRVGLWIFFFISSIVLSLGDRRRWSRSGRWNNRNIQKF